jgi:hypothetical protein
VLHDGVEQTALVSEEPVDRGRLHADGEGDRAGAHRIRTFGGEQPRGDFHELRAGAVTRRCGIHLVHVIGDSIKSLTLHFP